MTLIGIVADARRDGAGEMLAAKVQADYLSIDQGELGCAQNHAKVWRTLAALSEGHSHCVVLEDDAVPVDGFRDQLDAALEAAPAPIVSLYLGRGYIGDRYMSGHIARADQLNAHWLTSPAIMHAVALAVRTDLLPGLVTALPSKDQAIDRTLSLWARRQGHRVAYTHPSLVDHDDGPSLVSRYKRAERRAWRVGGRDVWRNKTIAI
ncbi:glycosyltransferase [Mycobacterium phage NiebruSaylor]|uniref:Glycosyltransferase n=3 Tax=Viruses TaxID=10239 RepID=A0A5P8DDS3_BPMCO|nr:glucosyltransferase [Mycobacterium phage Ryadel]AYQ98872.1 glycosyltransferase [Mycobacterium phage Vorrps]QFP96529.1 glycosyltransferase [Mycobacterium phage Smooch]QFP97081.1 glycosyltransferase [Mycobacterium phage Krili]QOC59234.1 glycosyltransferase [Mycobacterium phage NiebruSaylor]QXO13408.1 glycosyltransferase [Mycobacterium phage Murai]UAW08386.1 glycosyltransferase [Mycobacterium phage Mori]WNO28621.1 glycosyltransferase [Mycobacterium phage MadKillah]